MRRQYSKARQMAECMRSGIKCFADQLVRDGRNPALLVLPEWRDGEQPQERPFNPSGTEGKARFPIAPENIPKTASVLTLASSAPASVELEWTSTQTSGARVDSYQVLRATGSGAFGVLQTYAVDYGGAPRYVTTEVLEHEDATAVAAVTYRYRVDAVTELGTIQSNVLTVVAE